MTGSIKKITESEIIDNKEQGSSGISYKTVGTILQALSVQLDKGESIYAESGSMSWMTPNTKMQTKSRGLSKMISRIFTGDTIFVNHFTSGKGTAIVTFSTDQAGKIIPLDLHNGGPAVIFQMGSFLCAENAVDLSIAFTRKISTGFFGGNGFIMQKVHGTGKSHLIANGEVIMYELSKGQQILVDQGNLVAFEDTVDFDIQTVSGGIKNWLFGGEGLFFGKLQGPGKVWLQTRKRSLIRSTPTSVNGHYNRNSSRNPLGCIFAFLIVMGFFIFTMIITFIGQM